MDRKHEVNSPESQICIMGLSALKEKLGVVRTLRFFEQFDSGGEGDYTKEKYQTPEVKHSKEELLAIFRS